MNTVILLAGGKSTRAGKNKLWTEVNGKPLWALAHRTFLEHAEIARIILVVPKGEELHFAAFIEDGKTSIVSGGETRMESFKKGLEAMENFADEDIILDHNSANPFVTAEEISAVIKAAKENGAAAVAHEVVDTVAELAASSDELLSIKERATLRLMQTPQAVRGDILKIASSASLAIAATDLSSALLGHTKIKIIPAHPLNKKITFAEDLAALNARTFIGEDSHAFSDAGTLMLGGLTISNLPKLEANSDGDVILHAIGRALAQAQNQTFSEIADPLMLSGDSNSLDYLEPLLENLMILNASISLECARPRIDILIPELKKSLAQILFISENKITISAHTGESLTSFGRGEGIRCLASVTLSKF